MRPGLNLAISTIRAWNDIGFSPRIVAPHNSTRTQIVFHNPGSVDLLVAPVVVVHDPGKAERPPHQHGSPQPLNQPWPYDWPFEPEPRIEQPSPARSWLHQIQPPRPVDAPPIPVGNRPLFPSQQRRGGCIQVYANGGDCVISGNVTMAWLAFAILAEESDVVVGTIVGPDPPTCPVIGQLWWSSNDGQLYIWIGHVWVAASCCADDGPAVFPPRPPRPPRPPLPPPSPGYPLTVIELT